ncbi:MAG TPA: hypothetical protein VFD71_11115 [Planctomycetota bacterium]|nr:hypothetical protein [Planctomycetota bacterium]
MSTLRGWFLGNWRNKGVALFFAVTIWLVAYRSEKQQIAQVLHVEFRPAALDQQAVVITSVRCADSRAPGGFTDFDFNVRMEFSGPRKQIDKLQFDAPLLPPIVVPRDREIHTFTQADFNFPREGVEITKFVPESVHIVQDDSVRVRIENLSEKIVLEDVKDGFEVATKEASPNAVQITGPKSLVSGLGVTIPIRFDYEQDSFKGRVEIVPTFPEGVSPELVKRTVELSVTEVDVTVVLRAAIDVLPVDAVRVSFRVPPVKSPIKILLDDVVGETIPVEFYGRKDEIAHLRDRLREQPNFALGVRVPAFDRELGGQFTFAEDSLELYGFPGIQMRQHESRRKEKKAGWSYTIVPVKDAEK